jgi:Domain of unknown function DUF29
MLELAYWETGHERNQHQWRDHLMNARDGMTGIIEDSPSLEHYLAEIFDDSYQYARRRAEERIRRQLPDKGEWTLTQIRDDTFYPSPATVLRKTRQR